MANYYRPYQTAIEDEYPEVTWPFKKSLFAATTFNLGPRTVCKPHVDSLNLSFGWCAVTALGDYDYKKGGHLILWDLKMAIEFPPGTTILLPSATLVHSNVAVGPHETRCSMTGYTAGGLFRFVDCGFQTLKFLMRTACANCLADYKAQGLARWGMGMGLQPIVHNLIESIPFY